MKINHTFVVALVAVSAAAGPAALHQAVAQGKEPLVKYKVVNEDGIPKSLTGKAGDPAKGRGWVIHRKLGNCLACHVIPGNHPYMGKIGPTLIGVASRYSEAQLRLRVVNAKALNKDSLMPAFYRVKGLHRVHKSFKGKTILSAQQVEDIVSYLMTLKEKN